MQRIDLEGQPTDEELGPRPTRPRPWQRLRRYFFGTQYKVERYSRYADFGIWNYGWCWVPVKKEEE